MDLEGMPYVVNISHLGLKGTLYKEARQIATKLTLSVSEALHNNGFDEVVIADSHGPMVNLLVDDLPDYVELIRGSPRPLSMVAGVAGCEVALFLGYHAKFGTAKSTFDHTYSGGSVHQLQINDLPVSEFLLNGYAAGDLNVPVILVAGDAQLLEDDVKMHAPWAERIILKQSLSRVAARSYGMGKIQKGLKKGVQRTVKQFKAGKVKPLKAKRPVKINITFKDSSLADVAALSPVVTLLDGLNIEYTSKDMLEAYKHFDLLMVAAAGVYAMVRRSQ